VTGAACTSKVGVASRGTDKQLAGVHGPLLVISGGDGEQRVRSRIFVCRMSE
jgi:hypothetical protein